MASEKRLRRISQSQQTNMPPKRSASIRRAYNYVFRRERSPGPDPHDFPESRPSQSEQRQEKMSVEQPRSPQTRVEYLERQLAQSRKDLTEARELAASQDKDIGRLEEQMQSLGEEYSQKQEALQREKSKLEENMVNVVLEQIKTAREGERAAVEAENKAGRDNFEHKYRSRVAILTQELENARSAHSLNDDAVTLLRAEVDAKSSDLERAKKALTESTKALHKLQASSASAISDVKQVHERAIAEQNRKLSELTTELGLAKAGLETAQASSGEDAQRYERLLQSSTEAANEAQKSIDSLQQQLDSQVGSHATEMAALKEDLERATSLQGDIATTKANHEAELAQAKKELEQFTSQSADLQNAHDRATKAEEVAAQLTGQIESLETSKASLEEQITKLLEVEVAHAAAKEEMKDANVRISNLTDELEAAAAKGGDLEGAKEQISKLTLELEAAVADNATLENAKAAQDTLLSRNQELQEQLASKEGDVAKLTELQSRFEDQTKELSSHKSVAEEAQSKLTTVVAENAGFLEQIAVITAAKEAATALAQKTEEKKALLEQKLVAAASDVEAREQLTQQLAKLEDEKSGFTSQLEILQSQLEQGKLAKSKTEEELIVANKAAATLKAELEASTTSSERLSAQVAAYEESESAAMMAKDTIAQLEKELAEAHAARKTSEDALSALKAEVATQDNSAELKERLCAAETSQKEAEEALTKAQSAAETSTAEQSSTIAALREELSSMTTSSEASAAHLAAKDTEFESLMTKHSALEQEHTTNQSVLEDLRAEVATLKSAPPPSPSEAAPTTAELSSLQALLAEKDAELTSLQAWRDKTELELADLAKTPRSPDKTFSSTDPTSTSPSNNNDDQTAGFAELRALLVTKDAELVSLQAWREKTEIELADLIRTPASVNKSFAGDVSSPTNKTDERASDTPPITPAAMETEADPNDEWDLPAVKKGKKGGKKGKGRKSGSGSVSSPVAEEGGD